MRKIIILAILSLALLLASAGWAAHQQFGLGLGLSLGPGKNPIGPYWPVPGVTKPQHLWPFSQTGDYTDHGSTGGLTLTAQGSGNSFSSGLVLNGSGYADVANNADLCNLGSTFSIIWEGTWGAATSGLVSANTSGGGDGYDLFASTLGTILDMRTWNPIDTNNDVNSSALVVGTKYQIVVTLSGGTGTIYVNGSNVGSGSLAAPVSATGAFAIGFLLQYNNYPCTGTIQKVGILKGTAWSSGDVAAIYSDYAMRQVHKYIEIAKAPFMGLWPR